jgi:hypothetical protein
LHLFKKITACFFALTAVLPLVMALSFLWQQHSIREQMKERMEEEYLQTIVLHPQEFIWVKAGKEIKIGTRLFDVKAIQYKNNQVVVTGLFDTDEDRLHEALAKFVQKQQNKNAGSQLTTAFFCASSSQHYLHITIATDFISNTVYNNAKPQHKQLRPKEVSTPPPNA